MLADLTGKTAVVTGGGQGIGRGIALVLARQGADVAIADITTDEPKLVACEIEAMDRKAVVLSMDVTEREQVVQAMSSAMEALGCVDILVNNAGIGGGGDWERTFAVNVVGVVNCCEAVLPHMKERRYGKIINIASMAGHSPRRLGGAYAASKAAVLRYTKGAAFEMAPSSINVNAVCPGAIWTAFQQTVVGDGADDPYQAFLERYRDTIPLGRPQSTEDVGKAVAFLASDDASNITGQCLHVDGGAVLRD